MDYIKLLSCIPDFVSNLEAVSRIESASEVFMREGGSINLTCTLTGHKHPAQEQCPIHTKLETLNCLEIQNVPAVLSEPDHVSYATRWFRSFRKNICYTCNCNFCTVTFTVPLTP